MTDINGASGCQLVEVTGLFVSAIDMMDRKPGDSDLEDCVADVEREMRAGLDQLGAYDVEVRRTEISWTNRIELQVRFKRKVPQKEAEAILASQRKAQASWS